MNFTAVTSMAASATRVILFRAWLYSCLAAAMARLEQKKHADLQTAYTELSSTNREPNAADVLIIARVGDNNVQRI